MDECCRDELTLGTFLSRQNNPSRLTEPIGMELNLCRELRETRSVLQIYLLKSISFIHFH